MIESGSSDSCTLSVLYARTVDRAAKPIHFPSAGEYCAGTWARVASSSGANRSLLSTRVIAGEFSVRKTSAGEAEPSCTSWLASSKSSPLRIFTLMPVALVKPGTISCSSSSCWAL